MNEEREHGEHASTTSLPVAGLVSQKFKEAWEMTPVGDEGPNVDVFLMDVEEADRPKLEEQLRQIAAEFELRRRRQQTVAIPSPGTSSDMDTLPVIDLGASADKSNPDMTLELSSEPAEAVPDAPLDPGTMVYDSRAPEDCLASKFSVSETLDYAGSPQLEPQANGPTLGEVGKPGQPIPVVHGYEILGELGRGGMGVVYKARQIKLNRFVALKMVLAGAHAGSQQMARFQTEAEAVAKLQHPNIVQIYEVGEHEGLPYFSLEFVSGGSLSETIDRQPRPPREAAVVVEKLAQAMAAAHQNGIIHRDLKSANVLMTMEGTPKITDFGLAKSLDSDSNLTHSGTLMGTPSYMSPEQARGETHAIGPLSDLYSLGAILYELLTGRPPFLAPSILETLYQVRHQEPVPPRRLQPKVPKDLETICLKCLQKEPAKRYAGCEELSDDLHRFLTGEAIRARPVGRLERLGRWYRRNPRTAILTTAIAALTGLVAVSLATVGMQMSRDRDAIAQTRKAATERIDRAADFAERGDYGSARDLLAWPDPLLESRPKLQDVRDRRDTLRAQVSVYGEFKELLDDARFDCRFGSRREKERGRQTCGRLLALHDQIEHQSGEASAGLPPLNAEQLQLFKEDVFEAYLVAALVEQELASGEPARKEAARKAIGWLDRAETILPGTRALHVQRAACWGVLGDREADKADIQRAEGIEPTSAVDRFWRAFAEHLRGDVALRKKDSKAATEYFRNAVSEYAAFVQMHPDNFWGYFNWAVCLVSLNQLDDAAIAFTTCIRLQPSFAWPYNNRGTVHLRKKRFDQAIQDYGLALANNPEYVEAWANRGMAYAELGKTDLALSDLNRAIELNPDYTPAYSKRADLYRGRKEYAKAAGDYDRLIGLATDKGPVLLQRGANYQDMNRYDEALKDFDQTIALAPKDPAGYFARAGLHYTHRDYLKARDDYTRVIERAPRAPIGYRNRGTVNWLNLKDFDAALKDWNQMTALEPKNPDPHRFIGAVQLGRKQYPEALASLQKALALKPKYAEVIWARAQIFLLQGKLQEAFAEVDPLAAQLPPDKPETLNVRGDIYRAMGKSDLAAADYRGMMKLRPKDPNAYVSLAFVLDKQGKSEEAKGTFDQLVAADPSAPAGYLRRAEFRRNHSQFEPALADCAEAARLDPSSALPELVQASIEAARGQYREAVARAEAALKKAPRDDGHVLYAAACVWSLASGAATRAGGPDEKALAKEYSDRSAELLGSTLDKGFHDLRFPEHNRMANDPALAPVRSHPKVRELLAGRP